MPSRTYVDSEGLRVVRNTRCVADKIKSDRVEHVVTQFVLQRLEKVGKRPKRRAS